MKLTFCAVCGSTEDLHFHHFKPKVMGGLDDDCNILTLCSNCHGTIHETPAWKNVNHKELTKLGIAKRKAEGKTFGRPKGSTSDDLKLDNEISFIKKTLEKGVPKRDIAKALKCSPTTLYDFIKRRNIKV